MESFTLKSDWKIVEFGSFAELEKQKYAPNEEESIKCIELEHIDQNSGKILNWVYSNNQKSIKNKFNKGDVLFGKLRPYLRKYWIAEFSGVCSTEIWVFKNNDKCYNFFMKYVVASDRFIQSANVSSGSKMPRADWDYVASTPIPLPPLREQRAIARVLGTADDALNRTQDLIALKEQQKNALMQQLLTGKTRLPGFEGEWKEVKLGDVTRNFSRRNKDLIDARVYSVTNTNGFVLQSEHFSREVAGEDLSSYKIIRKHEFAYNPARINVGSIAYFTEEIGIISSLYVCFSTTKDIQDYFLEQLLKIDYMKYKIDNFGEGGVRVYLWYDLFKNIRIKIPSLPEQTAIAAVLQTADRELALLRQKADLLRQQKKALMQVLLTGKKRLDLESVLGKEDQ